MSDIPFFDDFWFRTVAGFIIGIVLGSFATMLVYRLPRGLSIISPGSSCPKCHTRLHPRDLIPILSYLGTHGKCRHCGAEIGKRYLWIEIAAGIIGAGIAILY